MTTTLTDRYIAATLRRIPEKQRPEIEGELRAAIADAVDARIDQGGTTIAAEYAALEDLGDPYRLAASYTSRPLTLIGPELYPSYVRSLKVLGWTVLPVVAIVLVIVSAAEGKNPAAAIFGPLGTLINVSIYMSFIVTLLFAIAERVSTGQPREARTALRWTPDQLPLDGEPPKLARWADVITQVAGTFVLVGLLGFDRYTPVITKHGHAIPIIDPRLWSIWIPAFFVLLAFAIVLEFIKVRVARWSAGLTVAGTILGLLGAALLISAILTTTIVNPALVSAPEIAAGSWIWWIVAIVIGLIWVGTTINAWRPSARTRTRARVA